MRTRERKRVGIINKHRVSWDLLKLIELFEHARRCGSGTCKDAGVSFGCEVKSCCRRHSYSRRHRDSWKSLCFPELGLQRSQCRVVKDAPAREEHGWAAQWCSFGEYHQLLRCSIYAALETFLKTLQNKHEYFHVDSLVIRIQSPRLASVPAPTVFYVGQTGRRSQ